MKSVRYLPLSLDTGKSPLGALYRYVSTLYSSLFVTYSPFNVVISYLENVLSNGTTVLSSFDITLMPLVTSYTEDM
ncbi:hypothetical protein [Sphingobacterium arenae]|uniref:Uncharacterized protein n=1 Tax=Sphingobacterium arenae TaxID=1280598 RepID=A0ABR7XZZ5_9SPHI|nr:hypothetical protein [Sphingobacterium arenae]MBD1424604.1 hypothetical protein [Sphingobacterium arenae]